MYDEDQDRENRHKQMAKIQATKLRELRQAMKAYVGKLGKHERGCIEELRLLRAFVAASNDWRFDRRYEQRTGDCPGMDHVEGWMTLFVLANDDDAFEYIDQYDEAPKLSVIEGPLKQAA